MAYRQGDIIVPVVNLNGSSADSLIQGYADALDALRDAIAAMRQITPHGRDYQTEERTVLIGAQNQHEARLQALDNIYRELQFIAGAIWEQKRK